MQFHQRVTAITDKLWDDYTEEEKNKIRKGAIDRMINRALPEHDSLSKAFRFDLSIFLEQLERAQIIPESNALSDSEKQHINDLLDETVELLIESVTNE